MQWVFNHAKFLSVQQYGCDYRTSNTNMTIGKSMNITLHSKIELKKRGGSAGIYLKEQLQYKVQTNLTQN